MRHLLNLSLALSVSLFSLNAAAADAVTASTNNAPTVPIAQGTTWKSVATQVVSSSGVDFAYRELGRQNGGTPVVFLVHLAAVLDNWDPRVVDGISTVAAVANCDLIRATLTGQDPKQYLFFTRTQGGIEAGKAFLKRLQERTENRDKDITTGAYVAQLQALTAWGQKKPADLAAVKQPVLVVNGDDDRMVPTKNSHELARRLPNSQLIIYPDAGHGGIFQHHEDFVAKALVFLAQ